MKEATTMYRHVSIQDPHMRVAYDLARSFYRLKRWNLKAAPVCVIVKDGRVLGIGISGGGMHQMTGTCARLGREGAPYSDCEWCAEPQHAEQDALRSLKTDPRGATAYLYGHWHMCQACRAAMEAVGLTDWVLLDNAEALFDHRNPETVIGSATQFTL